MMKEVESGKVGMILIKDMSRMGRDYLKVGQYQIARALKEDKAEIPAVHMAKKTMQEKINRMLVTEASRQEM